LTIKLHYNSDNNKDAMLSLRPHQERTIDALYNNEHGTVYIPTGGGKTICMIEDLRTQLVQSDYPTLTVVAAPRIMLALQLASEFNEILSGVSNYKIGSVHSGDSPFYSVTTEAEIMKFVSSAHTFGAHVILFTTYHSLHKIANNQFFIDTFYCDEAHNTTQRNFFDATGTVAAQSRRKFFFTATPKFSAKHDRGMNNEEVYGTNLITVSADELLDCGAIIPPTVNVHTFDTVRTKEEVAEHDADTVLRVLDMDDAERVLVSAPSARIINAMMVFTDLYRELRSRDYNVMTITSKHGAIINGKKTTRSKFFSALDNFSNTGEKFVLFHYSILSEGINVSGLTNVVLLRNLSTVEMAQTIGRVIRLDSVDRKRVSDGTLTPRAYNNYIKPTGYISIPVYSNYGKATAKRVQRTVDTIFKHGKPAASWI
jgi:superfamily II DNA or RNA helicase